MPELTTTTTTDIDGGAASARAAAATDPGRQPAVLAAELASRLSGAQRHLVGALARGRSGLSDSRHRTRLQLLDLGIAARCRDGYTLTELGVGVSRCAEPGVALAPHSHPDTERRR